MSTAVYTKVVVDNRSPRTVPGSAPAARVFGGPAKGQANPAAAPEPVTGRPTSEGAEFVVDWAIGVISGASA